MNRKVFFLVIIALILVIIGSVFYLFQQQGPQKEVSRPKRISMLTASDTQLPAVEGIKAGLLGLGYKEGEDIVLELYNPKGDRELTKTLAKEIVASKPDLIVSVSTTASRAVKDANENAKIPVVAVDVGNFKELGIENIQKPGGFLTGVIVDNVGTTPKRMEILKTLLPNLKTVGILVNPKHISYNEIFEVHNETAKKLGISIRWYEITKKEDITPVIEKVVKDHPDAFMTTAEALISGNPDLITPVLRKAKIPSIDFNVERGVVAGYLMVHGVARYDTGRRGAIVIYKVLQGEDPGNIPIEFSSSPSLEINAALAKEMGIIVPDALLFQANKIY